MCFYYRQGGGLWLVSLFKTIIIHILVVSGSFLLQQSGSSLVPVMRRDIFFPFFGPKMIW